MRLCGAVWRGAEEDQILREVAAPCGHVVN